MTMQLNTNIYSIPTYDSDYAINMSIVTFSDNIGLAAYYIIDSVNNNTVTIVYYRLVWEDDTLNCYGPYSYTLPVGINIGDFTILNPNNIVWLSGKYDKDINKYIFRVYNLYVRDLANPVLSSDYIDCNIASSVDVVYTSNRLVAIDDNHVFLLSIYGTVTNNRYNTINSFFYINDDIIETITVDGFAKDLALGWISGWTYIESSNMFCILTRPGTKQIGAPENTPIIFFSFSINGESISLIAGSLTNTSTTFRTGGRAYFLGSTQTGTTYWAFLYQYKSSIESLYYIYGIFLSINSTGTITVYSANKTIPSTSNSISAGYAFVDNEYLYYPGSSNYSSVYGGIYTIRVSINTNVVNITRDSSDSFLYYDDKLANRANDLRFPSVDGKRFFCIFNGNSKLYISAMAATSTRAIANFNFNYAGLLNMPTRAGYIGVDNKAKLIKDLWVGDSTGVARKVIRAWVGDDNGIARQWWGDNTLHYDYEGDYITTVVVPDTTTINTVYNSNTRYYIDSDTGYGFFITYILNDLPYKNSTSSLVVWRIYYNKDTDIVTLGPYSMDTIQYCPAGANTSTISDGVGGAILDKDSFYVIERNGVLKYYYFWDNKFVCSDITGTDISLSSDYYPISATSINGYVIVFFISSQSCISALFRKNSYKLIFCSYISSSLITYHYVLTEASTSLCGSYSLGACFTVSNNENTVRALFGYNDPWELLTFTIDYNSETLTEIFHTTFPITSRSGRYIKGFIDFNHFYFIDRYSSDYVVIPSINSNGEIVSDYPTSSQSLGSIWSGVIAYINDSECVAVAPPLNGAFSKNSDLALRRFDYNNTGLLNSNSNVICSIPDVSNIGQYASRSFGMRGSIINNKFIHIWVYKGTAMYGQVGTKKEFCFYMSAFNYSYTDAYVVPLKYIVNNNYVECLDGSTIGE